MDQVFARSPSRSSSCWGAMISFARREKRPKHCAISSSGSATMEEETLQFLLTTPPTATLTRTMLRVEGEDTAPIPTDRAALEEAARTITPLRGLGLVANLPRDSGLRPALVATTMEEGAAAPRDTGTRTPAAPPLRLGEMPMTAAATTSSQLSCVLPLRSSTPRLRPPLEGNSRCRSRRQAGVEERL